MPKKTVQRYLPYVAVIKRPQLVYYSLALKTTKSGSFEGIKQNKYIGYNG